MARESLQAAKLRWDKLDLLRDLYPTFDIFLESVISGFMGFDCTEIQQDIGDFMYRGPQEAMVQAQRSQAKTTIAAAYAVFCWIHEPSKRVLIISAGGPMAKEIAGWIIQIVMGMDELEMLRPDASNGDRESVEAFDVHYSLKGPEKSPSVACVGITSNLQGKRADLLIADDIESQKNSASDTQREILKGLTRDFTSICAKGKILYLGTPQSIDSVYNSLPSRGYTIRIWPGRYPTHAEEKNYGNSLAPLIRERMEANPALRTGGGPMGDRGRPIDTVLLDEDTLTKKELDQGAAYFQLQHMLDTKLMDADRYPLKVSSIMFMKVPELEVPVSLNWQPTEEFKIHNPQDYPIEMDMYRVCGSSTEMVKYQGTHMYLDPSGGGKNGDEMAYAVTRFRSGMVYLVAVGGFPGGLHEANQNRVADLVEQYKPNQLDIEDNFGAGAFREILTPVILAKHKCAIEGVWESGQKELRMIDTMEPLISGRRFVVEEDVIADDWKQCSKYGIEKRGTYSLFFQMARLTRDKNSLKHDDRLDAVAGSCRHWVELLAIDKAKEAAKARDEAYKMMMKDPLGDGSNLGANKYNTNQANMFDTLRS